MKNNPTKDKIERVEFNKTNQKVHTEKEKSMKSCKESYGSVKDDG